MAQTSPNSCIGHYGGVKSHIHTTTTLNDAFEKSISPSDELMGRCRGWMSKLPSFSLSKYPFADVSTASSRHLCRPQMTLITAITEAIPNRSFIQTKRASLLRHVNNLQSAIYSLPPEVLSHILEMVVFSGNNNLEEKVSPWNTNNNIQYIPFLLGSISSHWRNVVHSTPRIWTSLTVEICGFSTLSFPQENKNVLPEKKSELAEYYLQHAGALPLSLDFKTLTFCSGIWLETIEKFSSAMEVFLQENPTGEHTYAAFCTI